MIVFHNNGNIVGYQTYPNSYSGSDPYIVVADDADIANKKVVNGQLVELTEQEIAEQESAAETAALLAWREVCEVTRRQALIALYESQEGLLDSVQTTVDNIGGITKIEWDNALTFKRNNPTVLQLGYVMGWSVEQLDALFQAAEQVPQ